MPGRLLSAAARQRGAYLRHDLVETTVVERMTIEVEDVSGCARPQQALRELLAELRHESATRLGFASRIDHPLPERRPHEHDH